MSNQSVVDLVSQQANAALEDDELVIEDVKVAINGPHSLVRVTVDLADGPGGVNSEQLSELSRAISTRLDAIEDDLPARYTLEVTTPGASRWLKTPRHYRRTEGHDVEFWVAKQRQVGRVVAADDDQVTFQIGDAQTTYSYQQIDKARIDLAL